MRWLFAICLCAASGCADTQQAEAPLVEIDVRTESISEVLRHVTAVSQEGKVVVLDLWALWCDPCVDALPSLVRLQEKYGAKIHVIALNIDFDQPDEAPSPDLILDISEKLSELGVRCENIICTTQTHDALTELKISTLPAALIFDTDGSVFRRFDGKTDFQSEIPETIDELFSLSMDSTSRE